MTPPIRNLFNVTASRRCPFPQLYYLFVEVLGLWTPGAAATAFFLIKRMATAQETKRP